MEQMQVLKGTRDYLPAEQQIRNHIESVIKEVFELYGYRPLETPILNSYEVLASKYAGGQEILKEIYRLTDQGQRDLGLRYDLTVPFARFIGTNPQMRMPFKRYEIGKVFRNGPVKSGRLREFVQCDADIVGVKNIMAEAELINMAYDAFKKLNLGVTIVYNNRKLLAGILQGIGIQESQMTPVILALDKLDKVGVDGVKEELSNLGIEEGHINELFALYDKNTRNPEILYQSYENELTREGTRELTELQQMLKEVVPEDTFYFSPFLARGLEIYTGTVFEVFLADSSITSSIASGGRYDHIIGGFLDTETEYPAVGLSFGLDVIFTALEKQDKITPQPPARFYVIPMETNKEAMGVAKRLREEGWKVEMDISGRRLKKSLDYANKESFPFVLILGQNELENGIIKLRDMQSGTESDIKLQELETQLKKHLASHEVK